MVETIGFNGLPAIRWVSRDGASAVVTLQGAQLVSWIPAGGQECLYVSERSPFEAGRPIRGGVPVCFPQFADRGPLAQHGFARTLDWRFLGLEEAGEGMRASFALESSPKTLALWPRAFRLELVVTIGGAQLDLALRVVNTGAVAIAFSAALHTYFRVSDAATARLEGLRGVRFLTRGAEQAETETREVVTASEPIDRIYFASPPWTRLQDGKRVLHIGQRGFTDTVAWNPGRDRCELMADMPPAGYRHMLCVEAAAIEPPVVLEPGAVWTGTQSVGESANPPSRA